MYNHLNIIFLIQESVVQKISILILTIGRTVARTFHKLNSFSNRIWKHSGINGILL